VFVPKLLSAGRARDPRLKTPPPPDVTPQDRSQAAPDSNGQTK
jgi:hypothetical protein